MDEDGKVNRRLSSHFLGSYFNKKGIEFIPSIYFDTESNTDFFYKGESVPRETIDSITDLQNLTKEFRIKTIQAIFDINGLDKEKYKIYLEENENYELKSFMYSFYHNNTEKTIEVEIIRCENIIVKFIQDITELKLNTRIYCHNATHDWQQVQMEKFNNYGIELKAINFVTPRFAIWMKGKFKFEFLDTVNFFPKKLSKIGKMVGIKKEEEKVDFNKDIELSYEFLQYGIIDCVIIMYAMRDLCIKVAPYGNLKYGAAGTAYNMFLTSFVPKNTSPKKINAKSKRKYYDETNNEIGIKEYNILKNQGIIVSEKKVKISDAKIISEGKIHPDAIWLHKNTQLMEIERRSYMGARTEAFKLGHYKNVYGIDENAIYPAQMINKPLPGSYQFSFISDDYEIKTRFKQLAKTNNEPITIDDYNYLNSCHCVIVEGWATSNTEIPIIPFKTDRLLFINGNDVPVTLCSPEIDLILKSGGVIKFKAIHCYDEQKLMKKFAQHFMQIKLEGKEEQDECKAEFGKLSANSAYGKTGEKFKETIMIDNDNSVEVGKIRELTSDGEKLYFSLFGGKKFTTKEFETCASEAYPPIAAFITSHARCDLYKIFVEIGKDNILYGDTDSAKFTLDRPIEDYKIDFHDTKIGAWKIEERDSEIIIHGAKDYVKLKDGVELDRKIKGVSLGKATQIGVAEFTIEQWTSFKYAINHQTTGNQTLNFMTKKLQREYTKAKKIAPENREIEITDKQGNKRIENFVHAELQHYDYEEL